MWTSAQIVAQACADARVPGWLQAGGMHLQAILDEICETYDFEGNKASFFGSLNPSLTPPAGTPASQNNPNLIAGNGPYALPANYLRMRKKTFLYWYGGTNGVASPTAGGGVAIPLINEDDEEFDTLIQQIGIASLPRIYITDLSDPSSPNFYVYPPPNGAYTYQGRCSILMPAIGSATVAANGWDSGNTPPQSSAVVPWFPNTTYLRTRVAGELMKTTGDVRWEKMLGKNRDGTGAQDILDRVLQAKDDRWSRAQRVTLDARHFGRRSDKLPDTKNLFG